VNQAAAVNLAARYQAISTQELQRVFDNLFTGYQACLSDK
jgi:hypothetical protein